MREYASVSPRFWTGDTGKFLRRHPNAQRLAFYLMTCPNSNMIGLYYLPLPTIVHETGMTLEQVREGFERGLEGGFARYDEVSETVYVPEMARFQIADELKPKDNRSIAVEKALAAFVKAHKSPFVKDFVEKYAVRFHLQNVEGYRRGPGGVSDPCRSQDQDQDQDLIPPLPPKGGSEGSSSTKPKKTKRKTDPEADPRFVEFWAAYPRKTAKPAAAKAFVKIDPSPELLAKIITAVAAQSQSDDWSREGGRFIPYPATWLNARRWEDQVTATVAPKPEPVAEPASLEKILAAATANGPSWSEIRRGGDA